MMIIFKRENLLVFIVALTLSFLIYGNGIKGNFVFDDTAVIEKRGDLKDFSRVADLLISPYHQHMPSTGLYRPLTMISYAFNYKFSGLSPMGFHVANILIHALNSFLVFYLIKIFTRRKWVTFLSFILFLSHPIHTEAVTSIVGRAELLSFLGSISTIIFFEKKKYYWAALALFFAIMSKETAIMVLPIIAYLEWGLKSEPIKIIVKKFIWFIPAAVIYFILRFIALGKYILFSDTTTIVENQLKFVSLPERIFTALKVLFIYVEKLIWPIHLSADYSYKTIEDVSNIFRSSQSLAGLLIFAGLVLLIFHPKTRKTLWGFGAAVFLFPYLLVSNLLFPIGTIMGERLMYFSSLGFIIFVVFAIIFVFRNKYQIWTIFIIIAIFYGGRAIARNTDWLTQESLFNSTVQESPNALLTRAALGAIHIRNGEWDAAEKELNIARAIYGENAHLLNLLGIIAQHKGDQIIAEEFYKKSISLNDNAINSYINLGKLYLGQKRYEEAGQAFLRVIEFEPLDEYVLRYAYIQITIGKPDVAIQTVFKYYGNDIKNPALGAVLGTAYFTKKDYNNTLKYLNLVKISGTNNSEIEKMIDISRAKLN